MMLNDTISAVRHNGELSFWFDVRSGTRQGDIQGPPIFNFCLNLPWCTYTNNFGVPLLWKLL